jgi:hypothetical protein
LVRIRAAGFTYWCPLLITLALASCAFVVSFDALRLLVITLGLPESIAWLWPCAIDVVLPSARSNRRRPQEKRRRRGPLTRS